MLLDLAVVAGGAAVDELGGAEVALVLTDEDGAEVAVFDEDAEVDVGVSVEAPLADEDGGEAVVVAGVSAASVENVVAGIRPCWKLDARAEKLGSEMSSSSPAQMTWVLTWVEAPMQHLLSRTVVPPKESQGLLLGVVDVGDGKSVSVSVSSSVVVASWAATVTAKAEVRKKRMDFIVAGCQREAGSAQNSVYCCGYNSFA